jgi:signal transduction histidine kinase/CheY-like chemotaxis protein
MSFLEKLFSVFISPPIKYDEEGEKIMASYLKVILIVSLAVLPPFIILKIIQAGAILPSDYIKIGLELIFITLFYILKKGWVLLSGYLFVIISWLALTSIAYYNGGIQDVAIVAYILIIFLATLLQGIRIAFVITVMSTISVWILGIVQMKNNLIPMGQAPLDYSRDYTLIFMLVLTAVILFARSYRDSYEKISRELRERIIAEEKLSKNEIILKDKNEELNRGNLKMIRLNEDLVIAKEKAEESDRLKTAFIQNLSHEIRTPMNGILGFIDLLQQPDSDNEKKTEYIRIINSCTRQLATLVNDLIDISKIETGLLDLSTSEYEVAQMLKDLENAFSRAAGEKGLIFTIINDIGNSVIRSDLVKIKQVLNKLVSNAIKFTSNGSVSINLSRSQDNMLFSVADTGIGVSEFDKEVIFDRFRQAEIGLSRSYGGSGLGLAISKGYIEFLGGKIWVDSQQGKGSVFTFTIPVEFLTGSGTRKSDTQNIQINRRLKILAAEDDEINFLYIKELLRDLNFEVLWAKNGKEAVEIFKSYTDFDIVLMDLKMPVMNGYDATLKIKSINPEIPVIAVTAFARKEDLERATGTSFDSYIVKPIEKNDLLMKINSVLN